MVRATSVPKRCSVKTPFGTGFGAALAFAVCAAVVLFVSALIAMAGVFEVWSSWEDGQFPTFGAFCFLLIVSFLLYAMLGRFITILQSRSRARKARNAHQRAPWN